LVREANVNATVAEQGGKARAIRNQGLRDVPRRVPRPNPQATMKAPRATGPVKTPARAPAAGVQRPSHLRLVADHGRMVDPAFSPGRPVWVAGVGIPANGGGQSARMRVRLTRRGRLVLTSTAVLLIAVASMVLASAVHP
jgi:hypothetical protein